MIGRSRGILGYCKQYWGGYYPLLLIRMADGATPAVRKDLVDKLEAIFSSCLHTSLPQNFNKKEEAGLMDSLLRLYLHKVKLRCAESVGSHEKLGLRSTSWRCPGQCGLSVQPVSKLFQFQSYLISTQSTTLTFLQSKPPHSRFVVRHGVGGALRLGGWRGGSYIGRMKWARPKNANRKKLNSRL